ncbi:hypothetical protein MKZ15_15355 [Paenibacillus sp. FSL R7-0216]|uniref:phage tail fiber protein n=1 Tax=Paenibacillus sp. FSL R7-0216 TaxID=2921677 RepID=UPI0030D844A1
MAMQISDWLADQMLNAALRGIPFDPPDKIFLALYTSDPTIADTGTEVSGGSYSRQEITFGEPSTVSGKRTVVSSDDVEFPIATADWGLVSHVGLRDAASGGHLLWSNALSSSRSIQLGDRPKFLAASTTIAFAQ